MGNDGQVISSDDLINQMNSLESLYVIVKNFSSFSENGQLLINGNLYSIENLISSTINVAGNYGITINNPDSIKNFEDLKNAILEYKNKFDNIGNDVNNLKNEKNKLLDYKNKLNDNLNQLQIDKNNLNNKKIKLMDDKNKLLSNIDSFNNVITLQQYLSSNKSNLKIYMNANNSNIPNILDDICKELKDKIPEDNYNSVFKVVEMCKKNKNGNLENIIEILNRVTKNLVDDVTTIYIVGNLIEKLKEQSQNNNYKISSIRLFIKETNYSLLPAFEFFIKENNLEESSLINLEYLLQRFDKYINDYKSKYSNDSVNKYDIELRKIDNSIKSVSDSIVQKNNEISNKDTEITNNQNEIDNKYREAGVRDGNWYNAKKGKIDSFINTIDDYISKKVAQDNKLNDSKKKINDIVENLENNKSVIIKTLLDERGKKIDELDELVSNPTVFKSYIESKHGVGYLLGKSDDEINKLCVTEYITSLNEIYNDTIIKYFKFRTLISKYASTYKEFKEDDIVNLNNFGSCFENFLNNISKKINDSVDKINDSKIKKLQNNILKSQNLKDRIDIAKNNISLINKDSVKGKINFIWINTRLKINNYKYNKLKLKRHVAVGKVIESSLTQTKLNILFNKFVKNISDSDLRKTVKKQSNEIKNISNNDVYQLLYNDEFADIVNNDDIIRMT